MNNLEAIKLTLTLVSGLCWTLVYIDGIRLGFKDRSYAIPFYALALNLAWELLHTIFGFRAGVSVQVVINAVWFLFDLGILYTYFKYGQKYFTRNLLRYQSVTANSPDVSKPFVAWSVLGLLAAFWVELAFIWEFGAAVGAGYSAFLQNLLMSVLFIDMLVKRNNTEGQSLTIAVSKWLGTLAPTILFGIIGDGGFPKGSSLILVLGLLCSIFDLIYIRLLIKIKARPLLPA